MFLFAHKPTQHLEIHHITAIGRGKWTDDC